MNFSSNILLFHFMIDKIGAYSFSYYNFILAFPSFFVFADLGLGFVIFNMFKKNQSNLVESDRKKTELVTSAVMILAILTFLTVLIALIISIYGKWNLLFGIFAQKPHYLIYFSALICVFLNQIPSLGHEVLLAIGKPNISIGIIAANSFSNFAIALSLIYSSFYKIEYLLIFPLVTQLIFSTFAAYKSNLHKYINLKYKLLSKSAIILVIKHGFYALYNLTLLSLLLQFPRLALLHFGTIDEIANLTKFYNLLIPICALANNLSWIIASQATKVQKINNYQRLIKLDIYLYLGAIIFSFILSNVLESVPGFFITSTLIFILIPYSILQFNLAAKSEFENQKLFAKNFSKFAFVPSVIIIFIIYINPNLVNIVFPQAILFYVLLASSLFTWRRIDVEDNLR